MSWVVLHGDLEDGARRRHNGHCRRSLLRYSRDERSGSRCLRPPHDLVKNSPRHRCHPPPTFGQRFLCGRRKGEAPRFCRLSVAFPVTCSSALTAFMTRRQFLVLSSATGGDGNIWYGIWRRLSVAARGHQNGKKSSERRSIATGSCRRQDYGGGRLISSRISGCPLMMKHRFFARLWHCHLLNDGQCRVQRPYSVTGWWG